jgi:hypothetical protein
MRKAVFAVLVCILAGLAPAALVRAVAPLPIDRSFDAATGGEAIAAVHASCADCDWGIEGREAVTLRLTLDDKYSQHLMLARGSEESDYHVTLGHVERGRHHLHIEVDRALSAKQAGAAAVSRVEFNVLQGGSDDALAQSMAPILHARANTVGKFTDLPIFMWYEILPVANGRQFRYSVIFTNEDGGTATDRLMATWGRTTDIEYVYGATLDAQGKLIAEEFQGPGHAVPGFHGQHEAAHPLEWVATDNNMVSDSGTTSIRYAPAPQFFDLTNVSREVVMDAHPWMYTLAGKEMIREHKVDDAAPAGSGRIPDPRRYVYVEACTQLKSAAVAFSIHATGSRAGDGWFDSDRGRPEFRIVRTGCFRGAVPLPADAGAPDRIRFKAYTLPARPNTPPPPAGSVVLTRVNKVFAVDERYQPKSSLFTWTGSVPLALDGDWYELALKR